MPSTIRALRHSRWIFGMVALFATIPASQAFGQFSLPGSGDDSRETGNSLVGMEVKLDASAIVPGTTVHLGIRYTIKPQWHIYWRNPGESGSTTEVSLTLPEGFQAGPVQWPTPEVFRSDYDTTFGYGEETMLFVPITVPDKVTGSSVEIGVRSEWLVCKGICLFGEKTASITVPVAKPGENITFQRDVKTSDFARYRAQLPRPLASLPGGSAGIVRTPEGPVLRISGPARREVGISFLPDLTPGVRYEGTIPMKASFSEGRFQIDVPLEVSPGDALGKPMRAAGIVVFGTRRSDPALSVSIPVTGEDISGQESPTGRPDSSP
ncbi:MAG: hypothetical protein MK085_06375 [Phycisphaerales bacterium]|nr:hypothetical protein [Phycisphaerales bacterium]